MARNYGTAYITVKVHISLWAALKLRIAGSKIRQIIEKVQEDNRVEEDENKAEDNVGNVRIDEETGKVEVCSEVYLSKEGFTEIWGDYDKNILTNTLGICPKCHSLYSLFNFRRMALIEERKEDA